REIKDSIERKVMDDILAKLGLNIDELNTLRIIEPEVSTESTDLKDKCGQFTITVEDFQRLVSNLLQAVDVAATEVEKEKMIRIGALNQLKCVSTQRQEQVQQLQAQILEKQASLDRLQKQLRSLEATAKEQNDFIDHFQMQK
ncbi:hypothetical protein BOX15_Mlig027659g1, partial [Macrostomum lignano]